MKIQFFQTFANINECPWGYEAIFKEEGSILPPSSREVARGEAA
jgi:hypothetical protein